MRPWIVRLACRPFCLGGGDPTSFVDCGARFDRSSPRGSVQGKLLPVQRVDLETLQGVLQGILVTSLLSSFATSTYGYIAIEQSLGQPFIIHTYHVSAPAQLYLPEHGLDAENSRSLQDLRVRNPLLPLHLQYAA